MTLGRDFKALADLHLPNPSIEIDVQSYETKPLPHSE